MKKEYYQSEAEVDVAITKMRNMTKENATHIYDMIKDEKPHSKLLTQSCRDICYGALNLKCLEYLWIGCEKADLKTKMKAKCAYLVRVNEHNHHRVKLLFTLEENMQVLKIDEDNMLHKLSNEKGVKPF